MYFDTHGAVVMEQVPFPGNIGDSCAETCRYRLLSVLSFAELMKLSDAFFTSTGFLRHPDSPWREDDFTSDQALPLYLLFTAYGMTVWRDEMEQRFRAAGWKTGNGDYLNLLFISVIYRAHGKQSWLTDLPILAQAVVLRFLPYRWNESTKSLERTVDSSCDWLNYFHVLNQVGGETVTRRLAKWLTPHSMIMPKIRSYYEKEPNSEFLIDAYERKTF